MDAEAGACRAIKALVVEFRQSERAAMPAMLKADSVSDGID
jgi:hypothetical protein